MTVLTRPEGTLPHDLDVSRRSLAGLMFAGYAAAAVSAEAKPITTDSEGLVTGQVSIPEGGGGLPAYVARPAGRGRYPAIIVVSEVFGVHEYIRDVCRRLAKLGYVAVAPSFFVRADPDNRLPGVTDFEEIQRVVGTASNAQVLGDIDAAISWLGAQEFVDRRRLGITGFCWGGAAVWMACARFRELKAGVAWYGRLSHPAPKQFLGAEDRPWPLDVARELKSPVLGLYGGKDKGIPQTDVQAMRGALQASGKVGSDLIVYPQAQHGFHADYRESYDPAAARDGWARLTAFFAEHGVAPGVRRGLFG